MSITKYKAFVKVAELGSLTKAAAALEYSQPGISHMINSLEQEFGFSLLTRKSNGVVLTREGESIYPLAVEYIEKENDIYKAATELSGMYKGNVMIAAYASIAAHTLPGLIKEFTDIHPSINIQIGETTKNRIAKLVASGKADLAFCTRLSKNS